MNDRRLSVWTGALRSDPHMHPPPHMYPSPHIGPERPDPHPHPHHFNLFVNHMLKLK